MTVAHQGPFPNPHNGMDGRLIRLLGSAEVAPDRPLFVHFSEANGKPAIGYDTPADLEWVHQRRGDIEEVDDR